MTQDPHRPRTPVFGCPIDALGMEEAVALCLDVVRDREASRQGRADFVLTVNASVVIAMRRDEQLRRSVGDAAAVLADGMSIVWASRLLGRGIPARVAGIDLMDRLLTEADRLSLRVFFVGATPDVLNALIARVARERPGIRLAGSHHGYFDRDDDGGVIDLIHRSEADILFIGMPTPFKETWAFRNLEALGVPLVVPVGGAFDVLAGLIPRAPSSWQNLGMEWAWRLLMEPRRLWRRYLTTIVVFAGLLAAALGHRLMASLRPRRRLVPLNEAIAKVRGKVAPSEDVGLMVPGAEEG